MWPLKTDKPVPESAWPWVFTETVRFLCTVSLIYRSAGIPAQQKPQNSHCHQNGEDFTQKMQRASSHECLVQTSPVQPGVEPQLLWFWSYISKYFDFALGGRHRTGGKMEQKSLQRSIIGVSQKRRVNLANEVWDQATRESREPKITASYQML